MRRGEMPEEWTGWQAKDRKSQRSTLTPRLAKAVSFGMCFELNNTTTGHSLKGYNTDTKSTKRCRISWSLFIFQRGRGTKHRLTNCLGRCLEKDLRIS